MEPKEKAEELFTKMFKVEDPMFGYPMCFETAKQCALIAVDEIIDAINWHKFDGTNDQIEWWYEVRKEIYNNQSK